MCTFVKYTFREILPGTGSTQLNCDNLRYVWPKELQARTGRRKKFLIVGMMVVLAISVTWNGASSATTSTSMKLPEKGFIQHNFVVPYEVDESWIRRDMQFEGINKPVDFWMFNAIFPRCTSDSQEACIESVFQRNSGTESWLNLKYERDLIFSRTSRTNAEGQILDYGPFQGRPENLLPQGGSPSVWTSPDGALRVSVGIDGGMRNGLAWNMMARISISGIGWELNEQTEYRLVIRMGRWLSGIQGFLQGHLSNPEIQLIAPLPKGIISIAGSPVKVTEVSAVNKFSELAREMVESLDHGGYEYNQGLKGKDYIKPRDWNESTASQSFDIASDNGYGLYRSPESVMPFRNLEPFFVQDSKKDVVLWRVRTPWAWDKNRACYSADPRGPSFRAVISTNATVYEVELPEIDDENSFKIQIGSPSTDARGKRNTGKYHLAIEEALAKCLWKREVLPTKVELRIFYTDGREEISTLSVSRRNGFLYLSSVGFSYSSPVLRIKLPTQPPVINTSPKITSLNPKSIICKKGKVTKKVAGTKAKCPPGFKRT